MGRHDDTQAKTPGPRRIEPYLDRLLAYALSLTGNREEAKDVVQICAVKALSARRARADEPAYRTWLFRILRNTFIDRTRQLAIRCELVYEDDLPPEEWRAGQHEQMPVELTYYPSPATRAYAWRVAAYGYVLLADPMPRARFQALAETLYGLTRDAVPMKREDRRWLLAGGSAARPCMT